LITQAVSNPSTKKSPTLTEENTLANTKIADAERESIPSQIRMCTWETGNKINLMPKDSTYIAMLKNIKASS
jgi:hypothetical protein